MQFDIASVLTGLRLIEGELLLFAAFWFVVSAIDEITVDLTWLWLRLTGRSRRIQITKSEEVRPLRGPAAILVPAWHEADVIGTMISHTLKAWPHDAMTLYIGCYGNDTGTVAAAMAGAGRDSRVRLVILDQSGPTTKADCLNRLYQAMADDEVRRGERYSSVILHDAEDMVHPAALSLIDRALTEVDFVQLPVRPEPQADSSWVAGHYCDEFAEAHAKSMVVRDAMGAAIPAAGVGCGFSRSALTALAMQRSSEGSIGPFASECLTEDYEVGLLVSRASRGRFLRLHDHLGDLVATRAFFPATIEASVRQKTRWIHGIALQGWDRLGWSGGPVELWMALRDRRGPLTAIVLAAAYSLLVIEGIMSVARLAGWQDVIAFSPLLKTLIAISFASLVWRALWRFSSTANEYGLIEGFHAVLRIPIANIISIMAGRRALFAYIRSLRGEAVQWEKTMHTHHPALTDQAAVAK